MNEKTQEAAIQIIEGLNDKEIKKEVKEAQLINPMEKLGNGLLEFFDAIIDYKTSSKSFEKKVEDYLDGKMISGEMTVKDAIHLLTCLKQESAISDESLISLIRPAQGVTNPLLGGFNTKLNEPGTEMTSETSKMAHILFRLLETIKEKDEKKSKGN